MAYQPMPPPQDGITSAYLQEELMRIAAEFNLIESGRYLPIQYSAPIRPRDGMLAIADGTSWDPGSGKGLYEYRTNAWFKL